ncbi:MAG: four-carbon acid sugar kinase family protein [Clostridia bacterium]|nr:four-carbon acid sugar kinase family protein [Clostridia bacterium]
MPDLRFGCVADDFTGASDIASFFQRGGERCLLVNGRPEEGFHIGEGFGAAVVALKSRNAPAEEAVAETLRAFRWLAAEGAETLYFKYCSTFDSTPAGNIGPVLDAMLDEVDEPYTILCPALPVNGRTVRYGRLYVNGVPLDRSPMRNHPLNPMWDSRIAALMKPQSRYPCHVLDLDALRGPEERIRGLIDEWKRESRRFFVAVDYCEEEDGRRIASLFGGLRLLSGGSALAAHLCGGNEAAGGTNGFGEHRNEAPALILSGSCAEATVKQVAAFAGAGGIALRIRPLSLLNGGQTEEEVWRFVENHPRDDVLLYSTQPAGERQETDRATQERISSVLEALMADLARRAVAGGRRKLIVAGGETSGAVVRALGWNAFRVGPCVSPGVPVMAPVPLPDARVVLKSGNFGQEDFFLRAIESLRRG